MILSHALTGSGIAIDAIDCRICHHRVGRVGVRQNEDGGYSTPSIRSLHFNLFVQGTLNSLGIENKD